MAEQTGYSQNRYSISSTTFPTSWAENPDLMEEDHRGLPCSGHKIRKRYLQWWGEGGEDDIDGVVSMEDKHKVN